MCNQEPIKKQYLLDFLWAPGVINRHMQLYENEMVI